MFFIEVSCNVRPKTSISSNGPKRSINEENLDDFRLFRSFFPLNMNSEFLIDIKNRTVIKIE